jgi:hypothetical protein
MTRHSSTPIVFVRDSVAWRLERFIMIRIFRNILIAGGAYYLSWWVANPLIFVYAKLTEGIIYHGGFERSVGLPIVSQLPVAIAAAFVGACVVVLVDSEHRIYWALFPSGLYTLFDYLGHNWTGTPTGLDRLAQGIEAVIPAVACFVGGLVADRRRPRR